jgi:branched-subunit amino acid transport protein
MTGYDYLFVVAGMALVTYTPRWLPLFFLARRQLPRWLTDWLDLVPAAILAALLAPSLFAGDAPRRLELFRPELLASVPAFIVALRTRSLGGTVVTGMIAYWLLHRFI